MDRDEIVAALTALAGELESRGVKAEMYVVGGAAIALAFDERRSTRDVDAIFEPKSVVYEAAAAVAAQRELPPAWLNDAVKGFLEGDDPAAAPVLDLPGLRCLTASPETLLALKVLAHRAGEDEADLRLLAAELGLESADQVWPWPSVPTAIASTPPPASSSKRYSTRVSSRPAPPGPAGITPSTQPTVGLPRRQDDPWRRHPPRQVRAPPRPQPARPHLRPLHRRRHPARPHLSNPALQAGSCRLSASFPLGNAPVS
jgi:hypothetical protein